MISSRNPKGRLLKILIRDEYITGTSNISAFSSKHEGNLNFNEVINIIDLFRVSYLMT